MKHIRAYFKTVEERISSYPHIDIAALVLATSAYIGFVFAHISTWSIWFDEAFTAYIVRFDYADIARYTATDVHPPLYYWMIKAWTSLWGTSELAFRSFSMVCGVIAIVLGFVLLKKLFGKRAAVLGAWFIALSPMFIRYGEEARMYTMVTAIVLAATYVLIRATETNARKYWIWYGILIALGMWTHYFAALAWLAHWVWRFISLRTVDGFRGKELRRRFYTREWIGAHLLAIGVFLVWAPFMLKQLGLIQMGFWIPAVSAHTFTNYFTNVLFYLEQQKVISWFALVYVLIVALAGLLLYYVYRHSPRKGERKNILLLASLAFTPPLLLFVASMPPLKSSFVERYLIPASAALMLLLAVVIAKGVRTKYRKGSLLLAMLLILSFAIGINRVYYYGNYNKNSNTSIRTKELVAAISMEAAPGEPLIATDPWVFYEAVFYTSDEHPIYFLEQTTEYKYGSLDMLKDNDQFKIKDLNIFVKDHPKVWYFGNVGSGEINPPSIARGWKQINDIDAYDAINDSSAYKAREYRTIAE
ncbi:MAG: glycosyltransferase family 39 protein [Candidatus Saccharimonas sp.]